MADEEFMQQFLARAKERQAKLSQINTDKSGDSMTTDNKGELSYPALSPLPEEECDETSASPDDDDTEFRDTFSITEHKQDHLLSPDCADLDYSSDLSLSCDTNTETTEDVYRAEPVLCHSSPDQQVVDKYTTIQRISPKKTAPLPPDSHNQYLNTPNQKQTMSQQSTHPNLLHERQDQDKVSSHSLPTPTTQEQNIRDLKRKVDRAEQTKGQLKKAVEASKYGSKQHIEAARLLQITDLEHLAYTNNVAMLEKGIRKKTESLGSLKLSGIRLKISAKLRNDLAEDGVSHYFFCVASCGVNVRATEMVDTDDIRRQDLKAYVQFNEQLSFVDLPPEFVLKLEVFELVIGHQLPKLLSRLTPSKKSKMTPDFNFRRVGSLRLTLSDRDVKYKNLTHWSKHEESKYIERECKFNMDLRPEQLPRRTGKLHVRFIDESGRPDWSRFWVDLSEGRIQFWRSKQDAQDGKKPNQLLELRDLCSETIEKLTPNDGLYRQHSFIFYSIQQVVGGEIDNLIQRISKDDGKCKVVRHQLAAESKEERDSWCSLLDKSMHCFREWNGKALTYCPDELREIFCSNE